MPAELARFQRDFAAMMAGGSAGLADAYLATPKSAPALAVYRNNYLTAVSDVLAKAYPAVERLVGADFFGGLARAFIADHPPRTRTLVLYGGEFPDFIAGFEPARALAYLADVARLDRAWRAALFAVDQAALDPTALNDAAPEAIAALAPGLHASAQVTRSDHPAYSIWKTNREDETVRRVELGSGGETALVWRAQGRVRHRALSPGEAAFVASVASGATLAAAADASLAAAPDFDAMACFAGMLAAGVFASGDHKSWGGGE